MNTKKQKDSGVEREEEEGRGSEVLQRTDSQVSSGTSLFSFFDSLSGFVCRHYLMELYFYAAVPHPQNKHATPLPPSLPRYNLQLVEEIAIDSS